MIRLHTHTYPLFSHHPPVSLTPGFSLSVDSASASRSEFRGAPSRGSVWGRALRDPRQSSGDSFPGIRLGAWPVGVLHPRPAQPWCELRSEPRPSRDTQPSQVLPSEHRLTPLGCSAALSILTRTIHVGTGILEFPPVSAQPPLSHGAFPPPSRSFRHFQEATMDLLKLRVRSHPLTSEDRCVQDYLQTLPLLSLLESCLYLVNVRLSLNINCVCQEATVRTGHGTTDWFQIGKGVRQGCILSPCLFSLYAECIMRNAGLEQTQAGIKIAGRNINNLRYADDTTLMAESEEELKSLLTKVKVESE